jgi:hypothetical protein
VLFHSPNWLTQLLTMSKSGTRDQTTIRRGSASFKEWFAGRGAENITPAEIRAALSKATSENEWCASTANHHHNLISLTYRIAVEAEKIAASPIHRKVRKQTENNSRVRFLTADEEKKLDLAIATGLRRSSMYLNLVGKMLTRSVAPSPSRA